MTGKPETIAVRLGRCIRQQREARGLSQESVANAVGRTQTWLSYIEAGKRNPRLDDLDLLLQAVGLSLEVRVIGGVAG